MKERTYCVYKHTSPSNKVYIGITYNIKRRWYDGNGYLHKKKNGKYNQPLFARAILKYGWDNFTHEILAENLSKEQACELEKEYIQKYGSTNPQKGYNLSYGGEVVMYGKKHSNEAKALIRKNGYKNQDYYRSINQYDLDGNFIKTWKDSSEIYDNEKFRPYCNIIRKCCYRLKGYLSIGGYQWRFFDDCDDITNYKENFHKNKNNYNSRKIYEINPNNGEIIKEYKSITECGKNNGNCSFRNVLDCCRGQTISIGNRLFMYVEDYQDKEKLQERLNKFHQKFKDKFGLVENGQIIKTWKTFTECERELNICRKIVKQVCDGIRPDYKGYIFKYT